MYTNMTYQSRRERDLGLTNDRSIRLRVSANGFSKSMIYWGVKLFMAFYVKTVFLYFYRFTIGSLVNYLYISADGVLKSACNSIRAAHFWSLDILMWR